MVFTEPATCADSILKHLDYVQRFMTHRSAKIAAKAVEQSLRGQEFTVSDLTRGEKNPPSRQTIYRILDQLREDEWLVCEGDIWKPSVKARMLGSAGDSDEDSSGKSIDLDW